MEITVSRDELLRSLEATQSGLSAREVTEQSASFVFKKGWVMTYNDEISCRIRGPFPKEFSGVVQGGSFLKAVRLLPDDEIRVVHREGVLTLRARPNIRLKLRVQSDILLPVKSVDRPGKWSPVSQEMREGLLLAAEAAGSDDSRFRFTCVHVAPDRIEASDMFRMTRVNVVTPVAESFLLRKDVAKALAAQGVTEYAPGGESWCHFRNPEGLVMSCRRYLEQYPDLSWLGEVKGKSVTFAKSALEAVEMAEIFSKENSDDDEITVRLTEGGAVVEGVGVSGEASRLCKVSYKGPDRTFRVAPEMFSRIVEKYADCKICLNPKTQNPVLRVDGPNWVHITSLSNPESNGHAESTPRQEGSEGQSGSGDQEG